MRGLVCFALIVVGAASLVEGCSLTSNLDDYTVNAGGAGGASGGAPSGGSSGGSGGSAGKGGSGGSGGSSSGGVTGGGGSASGGTAGTGGSGGATETIACGAAQCALASGFCCIIKIASGSYDAKCWDPALACTGLDVTCDGPEDCPSSQRCCATNTDGKAVPTHIRCQTTCGSTDLTVCGSDPSVCNSGTCTPAGQFPQYKLCI